MFLILVCSLAKIQAQTAKWTLDACIKQALQQNVLLKQNIISNKISAVNLWQSKANKYPNLNAGDVQGFYFGGYSTQATNQTERPLTFTNSPSLSSSFPIYNGFKYVNLVKESQLIFDAGNYDIEKLKNDLLLNVIGAYMQVLYEYEAVEIAQSIIEADTQHVDYTRHYVNAGSLPLSNLLQVEAQLSADKASKVNAQNQLYLAKVALMQLMEMPVSNDFDIERPENKAITQAWMPSASDIFKVAQVTLPEEKSAILKTKASIKALQITQSEILPKLILNTGINTSYSSALSLVNYSTTSQVAQIGYLRSNPTSVVDGPVFNTITQLNNYSVAKQFNDYMQLGLNLTLTIPIFNNRLYKSDIKRAEINVEVTKLNETYVNNTLRKSIEQAYADQLVAANNMLATQDQLAAEEKSFHDTEIKFKAGTINGTDFFVEKSNYDKSLYAYLTAKYTYEYKTKIIDFYLGKLIVK